MSGYQRLIEHGVQGGGNVRGRICRKEEFRRCAGLKTGWYIGDVTVRITVFITSKRGVWILYRLVGNIKHGNDNTAVLERLALCRGVQHGGMVASRPTASVKRFDSGVLCAVGDEEDVGQRIIPCAAVADTGDDSIHAWKSIFKMRTAGAKVRIYICIKLRGEVCGCVVDSTGVGGRTIDAAGQGKISVEVSNERV